MKTECRRYLGLGMSENNGNYSGGPPPSKSDCFWVKRITVESSYIPIIPLLQGGGPPKQFLTHSGFLSSSLILAHLSAHQAIVGSEDIGNPCCGVPREELKLKPRP